MTDSPTLATEKSLDTRTSLQAQQTPKDRLWSALGHYAIGELSVGRTHNALCAYRLLDALEPFEARWKLGRAFCTLNLNLVSEAQESLEVFLQKSPPSISARQQKLLRQCQERLAYQQRQQTNPLIAPKAQVSRRTDKGKVLPFPNASR